MKTLMSLVATLALTGCAGVVTKAQIVSPQPSQAGVVCLIPGPVVGAKVLGKVLAQKRSYGELDSVVKPLADEARSYGANAVIEYENYERFTGKLSGVVVPFARGRAATIDNMETDKCLSLGGREM